MIVDTDDSSPVHGTKFAFISAKMGEFAISSLSLFLISFSTNFTLNFFRVFMFETVFTKITLSLKLLSTNLTHIFFSLCGTFLSFFMLKHRIKLFGDRLRIFHLFGIWSCVLMRFFNKVIH